MDKYPGQRQRDGQQRQSWGGFRLEGTAIYLLSDEIPEVAEHARAAARRLPA